MSPEPSSTELDPLQTQGDRVWVSTVRAQDVAPYRLAVEQSRERVSRWNPVDPDDLLRLLGQQTRDHRTFLIHARNPEGDHDIVGKINITNVVRGRFESAAIGYDAYDPYAGQGSFAEGLRLILKLAFTPETAGGMGLHRIQATVQPGNVRSAGLLRSLGFQREGFSPRMLWLPGPDGINGWQDHVSYALLRDDWPAEPYPQPQTPRVVVLVNGVPGSGKTTLARQLAAELRIPLFSKDTIKESVADALPAERVADEATKGKMTTPAGLSGSALGAGASNALWALLADSPSGGVVESWFWPDDARFVVEGLQRGGLDPARVPEVWCHVPVEVARRRFENRIATGERHAVHSSQFVMAQLERSARPLGLGPTLSVDTRESLSRAQIVRIALQIGA